MLAVLNLCQQGTPFIYAGEEIGMTNVAFSSISEYRDVETLNHYRAGRARGEDPDRLLQDIHVMSRDNGRTPMQWDGTENAGFTAGTPWIGVNPNYREINVAAAEEDPESILHFYRKLLELRRNTPALISGSFEHRPGRSEDPRDGTFAFLRVLPEEHILVVLNLRGEPAAGVALPEEARLLLSNYGAGYEAPVGDAGLRPYEAAIYEVAERA